MIDRRAWTHVGWILLVALTARVGAVALWQQRTEGRFYFGDSETYWQLARQIATAQPYRYQADGYEAAVFRTPGYPLLLAPLFLPAGQSPAVLWARVQSAVFGAMAAAAVWLLAFRLFDRRAALVAGLIAAVYPGAVATSVLVLTEAPFSVLMILQLCLWGAAWRCERPARALGLGLGVGVLAAAAVLVRPSWLLFTPAVVGLSWLTSWLARRRAAVPSADAKDSSNNRPGNRTAPAWNEPRVGLAVFAAMLIVLAPWWIRNWQVTGRFVPTTLQVGASLYDGLSPTATGASDMAFVDRFVEAEKSRNAVATESLEVRLDRRMRSEAVAWAARHPAEAARLALVKIGRMWNVWPNEPRLSAWPVRLIVAGAYVPIMILAFVGAWRTFHLGLPYMLCWFPAVYFTLLHAVFVSSIRYREPPMLALIVLAAAAVTCWPSVTRTSQEGR